MARSSSRTARSSSRTARFSSAVVVPAFLLGWTTPLLACPLCATATGDVVRAGITASVGSDLAATLAPFPILAAVVLMLHRGWLPWSPRR